MRTRLSSKFSFWVKMLFALFIFVIAFVVAAYLKVTAIMFTLLGNSGIIAFAIILFLISYKLSVFWSPLQRDRTADPGTLR